MPIPMWKTIIGLSGLVVFPSHGALVHPRQSDASTITWAPCPDSDSTQCALFEYTDPTSNATVSIFLRKYPATAPEDQRLGSLLTNPGGPGDSGSRWIVVNGGRVSTLVDGRYDIIGFDPRGVNLTSPPTAFHDVEAKFVHREYQLARQGPPFLHVGGAGEKAHVAKTSAIQAGHNSACEQNGNHEMLRNLGTVAVAKDMERIVRALGEDKLNYLGYSYGTILGTTFADLYPDLISQRARYLQMGHIARLSKCYQTTFRTLSNQTINHTPNWIFPSNNVTNSKHPMLSQRDSQLLDIVEEIARARAELMIGF